MAEASRPGRRLAGVLRFYYALKANPDGDLHEAARATKTLRRFRSYGVRGRPVADRGRAAPWDRLGQRACVGGFAVLERVDGVVPSSAVAARGLDAGCGTCPAVC